MSDTAQHYGLFLNVENPDGDARDALMQTMRNAMAAEAFGYHDGWVAEHHYRSYAIGSALPVLLAGIAARTSTIRLGSGASLLALKVAGVATALALAAGIALGKPATVPVGRYTQQALERAGQWGALEPKFVQAESVRQVLDYVSRGEAEAGFVYRTDAMLAPGKVRIALTVEGHEPATYPVIAVSASRQQTLAKDFIAYLSTPAAQHVLARYGFVKS